MPRARGFVLAGLGAFLAAGVPLAAASPALAPQEAAEYCPVGKPRPHYLQRLAARFDDRGNEDPADDRLVATLTLCGRADSRAAYKVSLDVRPPLFTDADRNGNGQVGRKDFCAQTRDAVVRWPRRPHGDAGGDGVSSELVPGQGGMPDAIRFTVRVAALERAVGETLPRDGSRTVFVWAHSRPQAARATPYAYAPDRRAVDRLPVPDLSDGCARPQTAGEALAVTLTDPSTQRFDYTGDLQIYTVPQGVSVLLLTVTGATGGSGYQQGVLGGDGGPSAQVVGLVKVTPGQQFLIHVGGGGGNATGTGNSAPSAGGGGSIIDPNGTPGGNGGNGDDTGGGGGGGGGASTVQFSDNNWLVVAAGGGGGGGGGCFTNFTGGGGGGAGPQNGINVGSDGADGSGNGAGAGGSAASQGSAVSATDALGGTFAGGGGGGGGGFSGGDAGDSGGGGCGGGGGGGAGSNYTDPSVDAVDVFQATSPAATNGYVVIDPHPFGMTKS